MSFSDRNVSVTRASNVEKDSRVREISFSRQVVAVCGQNMQQVRFEIRDPQTTMVET